MTPAGDDRPFIWAHGEPRTLSPPRFALLALAFLAAASLVPATVAAPTVPEVITGAGSASTMNVRGVALVLDGGAFERNRVCGPCEIRFSTTSTGYTTVGALASAEPAQELPPGLYDVAGFRGFLAYEYQGPNAFFVTIHGVGDVERVESLG